jgi:hypothetical protein
MPVLSKDQVFEALMELDNVERAEVVERLRREEVNVRLLPEQEAELREAILEHREDPSAARSWSDIKAALLANL